MTKEAKIMNLMQFARKAGKLASGTDACLRGLHHKHIHLIIIATDTAQRTVSRVKNDLNEAGNKVMMIQLSSQEELSAALGLPLTGVYGISDKNFAAKMIEYWQS
ncbi:MAG: ribosomal L7Ae/L30e/S12e/Gadd45 family protein [Candidatus Cloacimonetes bacterium]|nr:ribosomal L7Ae/L30e/S12e/Gadd45 family protein [Candidatus Cloacimonadota bacterium]